MTMPDSKEDSNDSTTTLVLKMTMPDHNERCRQLAELQEGKESVARLYALAHNAMQRKKVMDGFEYLAKPDVLVPEPSFQYDPRFAALRGEHDRLLDWDDREGYTRCVHCRRDDVPFDSYCLRKDADALLKAAAACEYAVHIFWDTPTKPGVFSCYMNVLGKDTKAYTGSTPAEAISAALWQAVMR